MKARQIVISLGEVWEVVLKFKGVHSIKLADVSELEKTRVDGAGNQIADRATETQLETLRL